jgi:membrane-associated protease RseP (regulator of RpoE activity)
MSDPTHPLSYTFEIPAHPEVYSVARAPRRPYWLHILLLLMTVLTTLIVGAQLAFNFSHRLPALSFGDGYMPLFHPMWLWQHPSALLMGIPFSATLMGILLSHEMGHFVYCEKYRVEATLPFFIPAPTPLGTLGAFIRIKSPIRSRQALMDIGVAGPIAGFVVAVPLLFLGLALSKPLPPIDATSRYDVGFPPIFILANHVIALFRHTQAPLDHLCLHPVAVGAWFGMLATALNLLPGGQLDGGHIIYAFAPRAHKWVTRATIGVLVALTYFWPGWFVWAVILGATGWRHPAVPVWPELDPPRRRLAFVALLLLALTFVPQPFLGQGWF